MSITTLPAPPTSVEDVEAIVKTIIADIKAGRLVKSNVEHIASHYPGLKSTIQWHAWSKPYGYAGDFEIIDKIYTHRITPERPAKCWDQYFHQQAAPIAVRNRKTYFKNLLSAKLSKASSPIRLLNIASGPARDLYELYDSLANKEHLTTTCVEMDLRAIDFAKTLNANYLDRITFVEKNIFRYTDDKIYDVVWSAGLFDYFDDRTFVRILGRMKGWLREGGEIIIGNFNAEHNPSRDYMEILGDWYLHHRSTEQLRQLAIDAGFTSSSISLESEPEQVNLFLHIQA